MTKFVFTVNSKLEILVEEKYFKSNIQDVTEEYLAISIPTNSGEYVPLAKGAVIEVIYYEGENLYKFRSVVVGRKFEKIPVLVLSRPKEVKKIQRRKYVRVPIIATIKYKNIKNQPCINPSIVDKNDFLQAVLIDLSGGGMKIKLSEKIKFNEFLLVSLTVNGEETLIVGQAKRVEQTEDGRYTCGLSFEFLDNSTREKLIKFIFQLMREQMRKI